ncbi:MAG: thiamine biosynthesis protein [Corynebacterium sp.]|nr:thiamine biosynthesis protein [Corynebacterium sp.]
MSSRLLTVGIATIAAGALLAGCTPPNENPSDTKVDTGATFDGTYSATESSTASSHASSSSTAHTTTTQAATDDEITIDLSSTTLTEGANLDVEVTGLNPDLGYYAAICAANGSEVTPTPYCTGSDYDVDAQAWLRNGEHGTEPIAEDGTASFSITPRAIGEDVNCHEEECVFMIFGDEHNGIGEVHEATVPVTFNA